MNGHRRRLLRLAVLIGMTAALVAVPLGAYEQTNCASRAYLKRYGTPETPEDLARHKLIHYTQTLGARPGGFEYIDGNGQTLSVPMQGIITVNNSDAYREACLAGLGIIQAPRIGKYLADGSLVEIMPAYRPPPLPISMVYANRRHLPLRVKAFIEWMKQLMQAELPAQDQRSGLSS